MTELKRLDRIKELGIRIHATTVLAGWRGIGHLPRLLVAEEVRAWAQEALENASEESLKLLADIAFYSAHDEEALSQGLEKLAEMEQGSMEREARKWQLVLLKEILDELPHDPLYGLLELTDFWSQFDFPSDSPHEVQGRGNHMQPQEYYTRKNFERLVKKHKDWLNTEVVRLRD